MGKKDVRKVDVFAIDRLFVDRIAEFLDVNVWAITLNARYSARIKAYEKVLEDKTNPDRVYINPEEKDAAIARAKKDLEDVIAEYKKVREERARFVYTKDDNQFKKDFKAAKTGSEVREAIRTWCGSFNLQVANSDLEARIMQAISGKDVNSARCKVNTGRCNSDMRKESVALKLLYGEVADYIVEKGLTIPMQFDDDIKAKYAPKAKKSAK